MSVFGGPLIEAAARIRELYPVCGYDPAPYYPRSGPTDPLHVERAGLFATGYAALQYAVASILRPQRIVEVGVGPAVAARAFLAACPAARYIGFDNGVQRPAIIEEARAVLSGFDALVIEADTLTLNALPVCDLLHIDGCHSHECSYHDMSMALHASNWILVDDARDPVVVSAVMKAVADWRSGHPLDWCLFEDAWSASILIHRDPIRVNVPERRFADISEYYTGEVAATEEAAWNTTRMYRRNLAQVERLIQKEGLFQIIEVGCGSGLIAAELPDIVDYVGVDRSAELLAMARAKTAHTGRVFFQEDVRRITPEWVAEKGLAPFHLVMCFAFLKHFGLHEWDDILKGILALAPVACIEVQLAEQDFDDGTQFHHVFVTQAHLERVISASGCYTLDEVVVHDSDLDGKRIQVKLVIVGRRGSGEG